ncbi:MAG: hypothetical protein ABS873_07345, partial [Alkalibacterium sp.]
NEASAVKWTMFHDALYTEMMKRKGVGHELIRQHVISDEVNQEIINGLTSRYQLLFNVIADETDKTFNEENKRRIQETMVSTVLRLTITFPDNDLVNRDYLKEFSQLMLHIDTN